MDEIWKPIPNYEGYSVSNLGRVKSHLTIKEGKILSTRKDKDGYLMVWTKYNSASRIHRLVLQTFNPEGYFKGAVVNHINGIKDDNRVINLEWVTISQNTKHAYDNNLAKSAMSKKIGVYHCDKLISVFDSYTKLANHMGIDRNSITNCLNNDYNIFDELTLKEITDNYDLKLSNKKIINVKLSRYQVTPLKYKNNYFESIKELSNHLDICRDSVVKMINNGEVHKITRYEYVTQDTSTTNP